MTIRYVALQRSHAEALEELERICFPTTDPEDLTTVESALRQYENFAEGAFVVEDDGKVIGFAMGIFVPFDITRPQHNIADAVGENGSDEHDPLGEWYYGTDIAVLPEYRGHGIGRTLYDLRKNLVRTHNRAGIVAGGVIPGFADYKHEMSAHDYVMRVAAGELRDPTLTFQIANGFEAVGAISNYMLDPAVDNWASFIVWHNPDYDPQKLEDERTRAEAGAL